MNEKGKDPAVYALSQQSLCSNCDSRLHVGDIVKLNMRGDDKEAYCLKCAGLAEFRVVPKGNAKVTRLAGKYSSVRYVILKWSELWKCYEREGILVESDALARAEREVNS